MVHARVSLEGETRERAFEREGREEKQRQEGGKSTKEGMAFELVLSIFAFLAVAALLGILVYQVNNNPIPFPSLSFLFLRSRWKFFCVQMLVLFLLAERVPLERRVSKLSRKALLSFVFYWGGGEREREREREREGGKLWAGV
jgi:hypothetical protein